MPLIPGNLLSLADQDFETAGHGWRDVSGTVVLTRESTWAASGAWSVRCTPSGFGQAPAVAVFPSTSYTASVYVRNSSSPPVTVDVDVWIYWYSGVPVPTNLNTNLISVTAGSVISTAAGAVSRPFATGTSPVNAEYAIVAVNNISGPNVAHADWACIRTASALPGFIIEGDATGSSTSTGTAVAHLHRRVTAEGPSSSAGATTGKAVIHATAAGVSTSDGTALVKLHRRATAEGPSTSSGEMRVSASRDMPDVIVQAAFGLDPKVLPIGGQWTRIDHDNCVRELSTVEGRQLRVNEVDPGECKILFDNRNAWLDPTNVSSPYYDSNPRFDKGVRVRAQLLHGTIPTYGEMQTEGLTYAQQATAHGTYAHVTANGTLVALFDGFVDRIRPEWHLTDATVEVALVDVLSTLAQTPLPPSVFRTALEATEPLHVWPLSDSGLVTDDIVGIADGVYTERALSGGSVVPYDETKAGRFTREGPVATAAVGPLTAWSVSTWIRVDRLPYVDEGTTYRRNCALGLLAPNNVDGVNLEMLQVPTGGTGIMGRLSVGALIGGVSQAGIEAAGTPRWDDGVPHHVVITTDGTSTKAYVDGAQIGSTVAWSVPVDEVRIGWQAYEDPLSNVTSGQFDGDMQYAAMWARVLSPAEIAALYGAGVNPWPGTTVDRFADVVEFAGFADHGSSGTGFPDVSPALIGEQNALEHLALAANGDGATLTVDHAAGGIPFYRGAVAAVIGRWYDTTGESGHPVYDVDIDYGDHVAKRVEVSRQDGDIQTAVDRPSKFEGTIKLATILKSPSVARSRASSVLVDRRLPHLVVRSMELAARRSDVPRAAIYQRPGDIVGVIARPPGRDPIVQAASIERVEHKLDWREKDWRVVYGLDIVLQFGDWADLIALHATWAAVVAAEDTWADVLTPALTIP